MISRDNLFLMGVSGRAKNMVVKRYKDKVVITGRPDMSDRVLTEKQKKENDKMKRAIGYAKFITGDARNKARACQVMQLPPNEVFRAIVKQYLLTNGKFDVLKETPQDQHDNQTLTAFKSTILSSVPDAEIKLFGDRAAGTYNAQSDWDILILTDATYPKSAKWELQEKLFDMALKSGARVNIILATKTEWLTNNDYRSLKTKIGDNLLAV